MPYKNWKKINITGPSQLKIKRKIFHNCIASERYTKNAITPHCNAEKPQHNCKQRYQIAK